MYEVRFHGRGGQGVVTAAALMGHAGFYGKVHILAFPNFGVERRGAPVEAYVRISDKPILLRSQVYNPDALIILDPTLISDVDIFSGVKKDTVILINSSRKPSELENTPNNFKICTVPATEIAMKHLGKAVLNTVLLGAFCKMNKYINKESLAKAIKDRFAAELAKKNIEAMKEAYNKVICG